MNNFGFEDANISKIFNSKLKCFAKQEIYQIFVQSDSVMQDCTKNNFIS